MATPERSCCPTAASPCGCRFTTGSGPWDHTPWRAPDVAAELTSAEYRANVDPALAAVLAYRPEPPLGKRMAEALSAQGVAGALAGLANRTTPDMRMWTPETSRMVWGTGYWRHQRFEQAISHLQLNSAEHPSPPMRSTAWEKRTCLRASRSRRSRATKRAGAGPLERECRGMLEKLRRPGQRLTAAARLPRDPTAGTEHRSARG